MHVKTVHIKGVNLYLISFDDCHLLFDTGLPNSSRELARHLRQVGLKLRDINYVMVSHFHVDHAGSVQEIIDEGASFILPEIQQPQIYLMEKFIGSKWNYKTISGNKLIILPDGSNNPINHSLQLPIKIFHTAAHSADSISVLLDNGDTFTGDLKPEFLLEPTDLADLQAWKLLRAQGAKHVFPGHGPDYFL